MLSYALKPRTHCERYSRAQSFSYGQTKRPPEGGLPAALMKAEIRSRKRPPPADLVNQPRIKPTLCSLVRGVKSLVQREKPHQRCLDDTTRGRPCRSLIPLQLPPSPMRIFARGIKDRLDVTIERSHAAISDNPRTRSAASPAIGSCARREGGV